MKRGSKETGKRESEEAGKRGPGDFLMGAGELIHIFVCYLHFTHPIIRKQ